MYNTCVTYGREGAQDFDAVLCGQRMRRIHAGEIRESRGRISRSPTQDMTQLRRISVDRVPRHQKLQRKTHVYIAYLPQTLQKQSC